MIFKFPWYGIMPLMVATHEQDEWMFLLIKHYDHVTLLK